MLWFSQQRMQGLIHESLEIEGRRAALSTSLLEPAVEHVPFPSICSFLLCDAVFQRAAMRHRHLT